jgi:hypothetical protein
VPDLVEAHCDGILERLALQQPLLDTAESSR